MTLRSTFLAPILLFALSSSCLADDYVWPMDAAPALTSTYAEYRSGRFHAGLDIKTWGKEGYTCLAVDDGYVWRVRTSPWGYGKAVYIKLNDGRTAVYAHLSGFVERIEDVVAAEQDRRGAYSVNLFPPPGQIPVKRGDPIGYSGSTGSGYPHLHFEIRDRRQRPLNPLLHGFGVKDTTEPTLVEVAFVPLDPEARIDGRNVFATRTLRWEKDRWVGNPVALWGRVGVSLKVFDRADASALTNKLAPYRLKMSINDEAWFATTYDAFSYDQVYQVDLDRNFLLGRRGKRGFHNLYVERGNTLPLYGDSPVGAGVIAAGSNLAPGVHELIVSADDAEGNRAIGAIELSVVPPVSFAEVDVKTTEKGRVLGGRFAERIEGQRSLIVEASADGHSAWQWIKTVRVSGETFATTVKGANGPFYRLRFEDGRSVVCADPGEASGDPLSLSIASEMRMGRTILSIRTDQALSGPPVLSSAVDEHIDVGSLSARHHEALVVNPRGKTPVRVELEGVGRGKTDTTVVLSSEFVSPKGGGFSSPDGVAKADFGEGAVYRPLSGRIEMAEVPDDVAKPVGHAYRFEPGAVPFREMVGVHFQIPEDEDHTKLGVYELTDKGWSFVWNDIDSTRQTVWAGVRHFSIYALLKDDVAPEVRIVSPADGSTVAPTPEFVVAMKDTMSGIPMEKLISFELNGETMIFEYDPEGDVAKGLLRKPLAPGRHTLVVDVRDTNGNRGVARSRFTVSR